MALPELPRPNVSVKAPGADKNNPANTLSASEVNSLATSTAAVADAVEGLFDPVTELLDENLLPVKGYNAQQFREVEVDGVNVLELDPPFLATLGGAVFPMAIQILRALGSTIIGQSYSCMTTEITTSVALASGLQRVFAVWLPAGYTVTTLGYNLGIAGDYASPGPENSLTLFSRQADGSYKPEATTGNVPNLWMRSVGYVSVPVTVPYAVPKSDVYYFGMLYTVVTGSVQASDNTKPATAPSVGCAPIARSTDVAVVPDKTQRLQAQIFNQTSQTSNINVGATTLTGVAGPTRDRIWGGVYSNVV